MRPDRAWVLLGSGRRLNLVDPQPYDWRDTDLAVGLSRTYRWGGHSRWDLPLSVAQHSLLVLVLRQQMQPHQPLTPGEALRELLHDADEGLLGFDPISPLKPHLGGDFASLTRRLQQAIAIRYSLPEWCHEDYLLHKRADHLAAASEALHVAGWPREAVHEILGIRPSPVTMDPMPLLEEASTLAAVATTPCGRRVPRQTARACRGRTTRQPGRPDGGGRARGRSCTSRIGLLPTARCQAAPLHAACDRQRAD